MRAARTLLLLALLLAPTFALAHETTRTVPYVGASPRGDDLVLRTCQLRQPVAGACLDLHGGTFVLVQARDVADGRVNLAVLFRVGGEWVEALDFCLNGGGLWFIPPPGADKIAISNRVGGCAGMGASAAGVFTVAERDSFG